MKLKYMFRSGLLLVAVALLFSSCSAPSASVSVAPSVAPTAIPATTVKITPTPGSVPQDMYASDPALVHNTGRPQVIEFFAFWCDVCHAMHPTMVALQQQFAQKVDFVYLDIDAANTKDLRQNLSFTGLRPTIVFLAPDGTEKSRLIGMHSQNELADQISNLLKAG